MKAMRKSTLETMGLGSVIDIFENGALPVNTEELVDKVFGPKDNRGALVISGANGIVGAGKMMQLGVRLQPFGVPIIGLDMPGAPDGIGMQYQGLEASFGREKAAEVMTNLVQMNYDGKNIPENLKKFNPKFLLEAIPEVLEIKKSHYNVFREAFPGIEIRSVTSGFPMSELGTGIAHPAFPHQINKIWEIVENESSDITKLFWSLGMIPLTVSDNWSFVLDVLFCGLALAGMKYHEETNMPFWKIDKYVRKLIGPNPFRAHDAIGAKGANFLTWSCLYHLNKHYGDLFKPTDKLNEYKESGSNWYPLNHLRPMVNWSLEGADADVFEKWIMGPLFQMTSIMLNENRAHLSHLNSIGELCAQFRKGILANIRAYGADKAIEIVNKYHELYPAAADSAWYPDEFNKLDTPEWQQLYVNAERNDKIGVITISREAYNQDVDDEMNRAIDWLKDAGINRVILCGDFHMSTQLVGADTNEFFPALEDTEEGYRISFSWSKTARRFNNEFKVSVGFINGKRCLGGMLELMSHCHYVVSLADADLGAPEVTLPVVPGMEMCHWPFRKVSSKKHTELLYLLLSGRSVKAAKAVGLLVDYAGSMEESLKMAWELAKEGEGALPLRTLKVEGFEVKADASDLNVPNNPAASAAKNAIYECIKSSCAAGISEALTIQAKHSANFMISKYCQKGFVGGEFFKVMKV